MALPDAETPNEKVHIVDGDLLKQDVDVVVNTWNRNVFPWWMLLPQGVAGAIKRRAGFAPYRELGKRWLMPLGSAMLTGAGRLPYRGIIHVVGLNIFWRSSEYAIRTSTINALSIAHEHGFASIALPLIGTGSGGFSPQRAEEVISAAARAHPYRGRVVIVRYKKSSPCMYTLIDANTMPPPGWATASLRRLREKRGAD